MRARTISRREFLARSATAVTSFYIVPRHVLGGPGYTPPSEVITRAVIGTGGMGRTHIVPNEPGRPPVTLAVCDVDQHHLDLALQRAGPGCQGYTDYRRVLERRDINTVYIAAPPHWHALMGIHAAQAGFDILGEKPCTRTIGEGRALIDAVQRYGRVYQVNTHSRFGNYYQFGSSRRLRKLVSSGILGTPLTVRAGRAQGFNWKIREWSGRTDLVEEPVPAVLDYDFWLGPAPFKPYHPHRVHGSFRGYWDYDGGGLSDMGQHYLDPIQYILDKDDTSPVEIAAHAPWPQHPDACGLWHSILLRYADDTRIIISSGEWGPAEEPGLPMLSGPHGKVYDNYRTDPPGLFEQIDHLPDPPPLIDFETAVRTRQQPGGHVSAAHRSCTLVNLANIAIRLGRPIRYNPEYEAVEHDPQANRLIDQPMRAPWHL